MSAMLKTMAELWSSIKVKLQQPGRKATLEHLCKTLGSGELQILLDKFGHHSSCCTSILRMASMMPPVTVKSIQDSILPQLLELPSDAKPVKYTHMLRAMFSWGREDEIAHLIIESIDTSLDDNATTTASVGATGKKANKKSSSSKSKKKRSLQTTAADVSETAIIGCRGNPIAAPSLAIGFLNVLISFDIDDARTRFLEDTSLTCQLLSSLVNVLPLMERVLSPSSSSSSSGDAVAASDPEMILPSGMTVDHLISVYRSYISLSIHMEASAVQGNDDDFCIPSGIVDLTTWATKFVQPVLEAAHTYLQHI